MSSISGATASDGRDSLYAFYQEVKHLTDLIRASDCGWSIIPAHLDLSKVDTQFGKGRARCSGSTPASSGRSSTPTGLS